MPDTIGHTTSTASSISVGGTTVSAVDFSGDHDWFRISLSAGQAITVTLNGITLVDPFLRILDAAGNEILFNDDINPGVNLDSKVSFAASTSGFYYIDVGAFDNSGAGDYQLTVTAFQAPPVWTNDQIAYQLHTGYWGDGPHPFNVSSGGSLTVNVAGLNTAGRTLALQALQTWSEITGITFVQTTSSTPNIMFTDNDPDGGAFTEGLAYNGSFVTRALVNIDTSWLTQYGSTVGSYGYQTYLHEIGHALGLGHAGNYNETATYPYDALFQNDSWATSVMSYFHQTESTYFSSQGFSRLNLVTPMVADILAVQSLYGLSTTTRAGDTTYGFNSNLAGSIYDASVRSLSGFAYTIFDTGGTDTIDFSGYSNIGQVIDLNPEAFSNIAGRVGNVTIARGTIIENAVGGTARDTIIGNSANNILTGLGGNDTLTGGSGSDTFQDTRANLSGDTITDFSIGDRIVFTDTTLATFTFNLTGSTLTYSGGSLTLSGFIGALVANAAAGGGVQLTIAGSGIGDVRNDFNGDGRSDVLWRSDAGELTNWLGQPNGGFNGNGANAWFNGLPSNWQIIGTGDFNGDGKDDLLWRSTSGELTNWLGQANGGFVNNGANLWSTNLPSSWQVVGIGDFNGDGRDDLMWQSTSGEFSNWLGTASGGFTNNGANAWGTGPASWHIISVGDFNGDGRDDILWRSDAGQMTNWLGQANGGFVNNGANAWFTNLPSSWQVVGTGDFNGDGRDDLMWRSTSGEYSNWLGTANGSFINNGANAFGLGPTSWHIVGIGDYNGDGKDDLLWRSNTGELSNWLGTASGGFTNNAANSWSVGPTSWHVQPDLDFWI